MEVIFYCYETLISKTKTERGGCLEKETTQDKKDLSWEEKLLHGRELSSRVGGASRIEWFLKEELLGLGKEELTY